MMFSSVGEFPLYFYRNCILWWMHTLRFQGYVEQKCKEAAVTLDLSRTRTRTCLTARPLLVSRGEVGDIVYVLGDS